MKGVIVNCLSELVKGKFGEDKWDAAMEKAGMDPDTVFLATADIGDADVLKVIGSLCEVLGITLQQAADAFGEYWVGTFAPRVYEYYFRGVDNAKDFLLKMDSIHEITTKNVKNAKPPRFAYEWQDDSTLVMKYKSERGLLPIFVGLIKGVGKRFGEDLEVIADSGPDVRIVFSRSRR